MKINLSPDELYKLSALASMRSGAKENLDYKDGYVSHSSFDRHFLGLRAEYATAKLFHTTIDISFNWGDRDQPDLYLPDGRSVQVKCNFKDTVSKRFYLRNGHLSELKSDILVLCTEVNKSTIDVAYWCTKEHFIDNYIEIGIGGKEKFALDSNNMFLVEELVKTMYPETLIVSEEHSKEILFHLEFLNKSIKYLSKGVHPREDYIELLSLLDKSVINVNNSLGQFK